MFFACRMLPDEVFRKRVICLNEAPPVIYLEPVWRNGDAVSRQIFSLEWPSVSFVNLDTKHCDLVDRTLADNVQNFGKRKGQFVPYAANGGSLYGFDHLDVAFHVRGRM